MKMRRLLSWTGLALCVVYLLLTAWLVHGAQSDADPKGAYILMSLPITLQSAALDAIGAGSLLYRKPWSTAYAVLVPPTLLLLYAAGWLIERAARGR
ncbi:TPA: hypothetical protein UM521_002835 [Stenotrophomonas maltophilia]|uniref:hypothetical protein n=1 Tax=Stenotrophomonas maltophilia TaxID=40324 RepID=UPI00066CC3A9|nr:hypothetical protein [Stenotrophomonas maltophilia]EKT4445559.1 hypothetical protein [Stenotrophomonas maltophilia]MBH1467290.1 hypothetical protein [Stenotrophomonas maltophilia]MBH1616165.1 hypothetical protein [Stenotrophomonas maltophilia]MBN5080569.1 hypothetical protein [Stenotrophomonas maltophilia]MBN5169393.1 hypothetical protein [Stenotrophomonas maltophilia]